MRTKLLLFGAIISCALAQAASAQSIGVGVGFGRGYNSGYGGYYSGYPGNYSGYPYGYNNSHYPYHRRPVSSGYNGNVVARVQQRLGRLGYYGGVIDGIYGRQTRRAIYRFERTNGLRADGQIDGRLLARLDLR